MAAKFPHDILPYPVRDGYARDAANQHMITRMDDGHNLIRRTSRGLRLKDSFTWMMNDTQFAKFKAWLAYSMHKGVDWFDMKAGPNEDEQTYKFMSEPKYAYDKSRNKWRVSGEVVFLSKAAQRKPVAFLAKWPDVLPWPEKDEHNVTSEDYIMTDENTDNGLPESRVRFDEKWSSFSNKWIMDGEQKLAFERFLSDDIALGVAFFLAPFYDDQGERYVKARFLEYPRIQPIGALWGVTAKLETREAGLMDIGEWNKEIFAPTSNYAMSAEMITEKTMALFLESEFRVGSVITGIDNEIPAASEYLADVSLFWDIGTRLDTSYNMGVDVTVEATIADLRTGYAMDSSIGVDYGLSLPDVSYSQGVAITDISITYEINLESSYVIEDADYGIVVNDGPILSIAYRNDDAGQSFAGTYVEGGYWPDDYAGEIIQLRN
ncbi:hypothetical protein Axy19_055 [Achromobacter phage vB_AxyS_19-32_Axy19]|nr:hypothetical protein Axy18_054 [Achromobacter phage vB_AxyS_19-32_Axy18]QDH84420.1 hypothetical protein Axy19_055 [Achromobacter phage vB_AxyS_19-32_Axy19]